MTLANVTGQNDLDAAVAERMRRQEILYDQTREFEFLLTEAAVFSRFCEPEVMLQQVELVRAFSRLPNVRIGLIPNSARLPNIPQNSFAVYDCDVVAIETFGGMITITDECDIRLYRDLFEQFAAAAIYDESANNLLNSCEQELRDWK